MNTIELARELGKSIQNEQAYLNFQVISQQSDADQALQDLIGEFNLKRMAINNEAEKENRDEEKIRKYNEELRALYSTIMQNENMAAYNKAKDELDALVQRVTNIIAMCAEGADPDTCDYDAASCSGNCASCAGCH